MHEKNLGTKYLALWTVDGYHVGTIRADILQ